MNYRSILGANGTALVSLTGRVNYIAPGNTSLLSTVTLSEVTIFPYQPDEAINALVPLGTTDSLNISVPSQVARYLRTGSNDLMVVQVVDRGDYLTFESQGRLRGEEILKEAACYLNSLTESLNRGGPADIQRSTASTIREKLNYVKRQFRFLPYVGQELNLAALRTKHASLTQALQDVLNTHPETFQAPETTEQVISSLKSLRNARSPLANALATHLSSNPDDPLYVVGLANVDSIQPASRGNWKVTLSDLELRIRDENRLFSASEPLCDLDRLFVFVSGAKAVSDLAVEDYLSDWANTEQPRFPFTARVITRTTPDGSIDVALDLKKAINLDELTDEISILLDEWESALQIGLEGTARIHKKIRKRLDSLDLFTFHDTHCCLKPNTNALLRRYQKLQAQVEHMMLAEV